MKKKLRILLSSFLVCAIVLSLEAGFAGFAVANDTLPGTVLTTSAMDGGAMCVSGQAIACVDVGCEQSLAEVADRYETVLTLDDVHDCSGTRELVLATSLRLSAFELVAALQACPGVYFAEPNYEVTSHDGRAYTEPAEEASCLVAQGAGQNEARETVRSAALARDFNTAQYAFNGEHGIDVPQWNTYGEDGTPAPQVDANGNVVAIIDTGIDYTHADLADAMWDEGENYPTLVALGGGPYGINVASPRADGSRYNSADPMDDDGHGTHVAGIVAGRWNNFGISGCASGARVMAAKIMNDKGALAVDGALKAYGYVIAAQRAGVPVVAINNSWDDDVYSRALDLAVREAGELGAVTVFAAGNDRVSIDLEDQVPNSFANNPYAVVVGNSNRQGERSESSCVGRRAVDVFAPGQDIYSTIVTGTGPGNELASPLVVGDIAYSCDFESSSVTNNTDDGVFGFSGCEGALLDLAEEGHDSAHSLCIAGETTEDMSVTVSAKELAPGDECRGLCLWIKSPPQGYVDAMLVYATNGAMDTEHHVKVSNDDGGWQVVSFPIAANAIKENLQCKLTFTLYVEDESTASGCKVLLDDIKFVGETVPYDYMTGTSQAAPAVAGGAAVLAAAYPADDAAQRAARIVGSVRPVASLADACVSGGVFSLRKALLGETAPVLNSLTTTESTITLEGYFFGVEQGTIVADGQKLPVTSWTDTAVTAELPSGFAGGEKLVVLTAADGGAGHQRFRIGTPSSLYKRLPLPGQILHGEPGTYEVAPSGLSASFYASAPRALVGLGGSLYYVLETLQETTAIYRYNIAAQTWELVYEGGYAAGGGACTWDGGVLFVAGQPHENKTYLGFFDPTTRDVTYTLTSDESFERECTLVNTGKGVLLAGGRKYVHGSSDRLSIEEVRMVNPATMDISVVPTSDGEKLYDSWYAGAYDEQGRAYIFGGTATKDFHRLSFSEGGVTCETMEVEPAAPEKSEDEEPMFAEADGSMPIDQSRRMAAGSTKDGIIACGPVTMDEAGVVVADTYKLGWGDKKFKATDKHVSVTKMHNQVVTAYRGNFYVLADTDSETDGKVFVATPVETIEQPGDAGPQDPPKEDGEGKMEQPEASRASTVAPGAQSAHEVQGVGSRAGGTGVQATPTKLPDTSDALARTSLVLVVVGTAAIATALTVVRQTE